MLAHRAEIVADMQLSGRLYPRENSQATVLLLQNYEKRSDTLLKAYQIQTGKSNCKWLEGNK